MNVQGQEEAAVPCTEVTTSLSVETVVLYVVAATIACTCTIYKLRIKLVQDTHEYVVHSLPQATKITKSNKIET